jgi:hypothetical protein
MIIRQIKEENRNHGSNSTFGLIIEAVNGGE